MVRNPPTNAGDIRDVGVIPRLERPPGGGHDKPTPVFLPGESQDRRAWQATIHKDVKS